MFTSSPSSSFRANAFSSVLFTKIILTPSFIKFLHTILAVSPTPITIAEYPLKSPSSSFAFLTAILATLTGLFDIWVWFLIFFAHLKEKCISLVKSWETKRFSYASLKASFSCPVICTSPTTIESSEEASLNICSTASKPS